MQAAPRNTLRDRACNAVPWAMPRSRLGQKRLPSPHAVSAWGALPSALEWSNLLFQNVWLRI